MKKSDKDARFEEAKLRMVMKLRNVSREEAAKSISTNRVACADAVGKEEDDLLIPAEEFFGGM